MNNESATLLGNALGISSSSPIIAIIIVLGFLIPAIGKWYFSNQSTIISPKEAKIKRELDSLRKLLDSETDLELKNILDEQRKDVLFYSLTSIRTNGKIRSQLIEIKGKASDKFTWRDIKIALPHMKRDNSSKIIRGLPSYSKFYVIVNSLYSILFIIFSYRLPTITYKNMNVGTILVYESVYFTSFIILLSISAYFFTKVVAVIRAQQLQKWI